MAASGACREPPLGAESLQPSIPGTWHLLLSPFCVVTAFLGLQLASSSRASAAGLAGLALALWVVDGHSHAASVALGPTAPPAQGGGHGTTATPSGFGDPAPGHGQVRGGPAVSCTAEENVRLRGKACQAEQGNPIVPDEHCRWKDTVQSLSPHGHRLLTHHMGFPCCCLILPLCKAMSILVTVITGIQLLASFWRSYQSQRARTGGWPECPPDVVWGASDFPDCAICLLPCEPSWPLKLLSCSHVYHGKCIDRWHRAQPGTKTCPLCLHGVTTVLLIHPRARRKQE